MTLEVVPAVHLDRGRFPEYPDADPVVALAALAKRFERVCVVDVEGIRRNRADLAWLQEAARKRSLWVDAGSRFATDAMDLFVAGAETVTMRWNTLDSPAELDEAASMCQPGSLFLALEFPAEGFLRHPKDGRDATQVAALADDLGLGLVYVVPRGSLDALRALPSATATRFVQGVPSAVAAQAQELGFAGALLSPDQLPEPKREHE